MRKFLLASASVAGLAAVPGAALAQTESTTGTQPAAEQPQQGAQTSDQEDSGEVLITAQRREESAQRAAIAIDVVTGQQLIESGVTNAPELSRLVPALTIQQIGSNNAAFIRGVGNFSVAQASESAVAYNYDGVYLGRQQASGTTFFDLARVEVLKGPQGTLYGRNATAGVINVIPARPQPGETSGYATTSYGNYNALTAEGAINIGTGDSSAFRLSAAVTHRDGYLSDGTSDSETQAVRAQFLASPASGLTVRIAGDYMRLGGSGPGPTFLQRQTLNLVTGTYTLTSTGIPLSQGVNSPASQAFYTSLPTGGLTAPVAVPPGLRGRLRDPFPEPNRNLQFYGVTGEITYDTGDGILTIIPAVRWDHYRLLTPAGGFPVATDQRDRQHSIEVRFAGNIGPIDYTLGAFYYDERVEVLAGAMTFGTATSFSAPQIIETNSIAPFARLVANLNEQLRLVGGIRYTRDRRSIDAIISRISVSCNPGFTCADAILPIAVTTPDQLPFTVPPPGTSIAGPTPNTRITRDPNLVFDENLSFGRVTWRGAVEFDVAPASLLYASVETGFRSGGFNISEGFETYEPEYITAYTLGSKNRFFRNRVQLNIEAFHWRYRNQQIAHPGVDIAFRPGSITENIGRSTIQGVEVDGRFLVTRSTILSTSIAYLDAENEEFVYTVPSPFRPRTNCVITPSVTRPTFFDVNCAGLPAFNSPRWTFNLELEQTVPIGEYELVVSGNTQYKSGRYLGFEYQPEQFQDSSWTSNAQVSFGPADGRWSLAAYVRNIENDRLIAAPFAFGGLLAAYTTPPRTYGIRGSFRF